MYVSGGRRVPPRVVPASDLSGGEVYRSASFGLSEATLGRSHLLTGEFGRSRCSPDGQQRRRHRRRRRRRRRGQSQGAGLRPRRPKSADTIRSFSSSPSHRSAHRDRGEDDDASDDDDTGSRPLLTPKPPPPQVDSGQGADSLYLSPPPRAALSLKGYGYISVAPLECYAECKSSFTVETWLYISRTEALYSESSTRVRKHNGLECDSEGKFKSWKCCGRNDPDPLSWCPVWQGDTRNIVSVVSDPQDDEVKYRLYSGGSPEAIVAKRRTCPCVIVSQEISAANGSHANSFFLHDAGCVAPDGTEYGFGVRCVDGSVTVVTDYHVPVDRWVYLAAVYDGCYLGVYIDGELVASKCRDTPTAKDQQHNISECMISGASPVTVGGDVSGLNNFVGCELIRVGWEVGCFFPSNWWFLLFHFLLCCSPLLRLLPLSCLRPTYIMIRSIHLSKN